MAPPRKKRKAGETHPIHLRLPTDVFQRIEAETKKTGWPLNRVIINELAAFPDLDKLAKLGERIRDLEVILARYGARIVVVDLTDNLLRTLYEMVKADDADKVGEVRAKVAKVRVILGAMEKHERETK